MTWSFLIISAEYYEKAPRHPHVSFKSNGAEKDGMASTFLPNNRTQLVAERYPLAMPVCRRETASSGDLAEQKLVRD